MLDNLILLNAVPHDKYFQWQEEVFITNARKHGISHLVHVVVFVPKGSAEMPNWKRLQEKYPEVGFFFYPNKGVELGLYIPLVRPHSLKQHFQAMGDGYKDKVFFYHDSDIIFNRLPAFQSLLSDDVCWQSNTSSYLDYSYLVRKEKQKDLPEGTIVDKMAEIGEITPEIIANYDGKTGGAQYILKGIDAEFWQDVEDMSIKIRKAFYYGIKNSVNNKYFSSENEGLQSWCADMWAVNFSLWKRGKVTDISPELDFSWATDPLEVYKMKPIFHNAGASGGSNLFYKGKYLHKDPFHDDLSYVPENSASYAYVQAIKEVK